MKQLAGLILIVLPLLAVNVSHAAPHEKHQHNEASEQMQHEQYQQEKGKSKEKKRHRGDGRLKAGMPLPEEFRNAQRVDFKNGQNLSEPSRYQQWVKVKDRYVLMNVLTNTIIKVEKE